MNAKPSSRPSRRRIVGGLIAGLAALTIAAPAQADLSAGVTNGGCLEGIQVGHIHKPNGDIVPICRTVN